MSSACAHDAENGVTGCLRIGVIVESHIVPQWISLTLAQLSESDFLDVTLFVVNRRDEVGGSYEAPSQPKLAAALWALYSHLDHRLFASTLDAFAPVDIADRFERPRILIGRMVNPMDPTPSFAFGIQGRTILDSLKLDVILPLGLTIAEPELAACAQHGVWFLRHGSVPSRAAPPLFAEMLAQTPVSSVTLEITAREPSQSLIVYRSYSATDPVSWQRHRNSAYWKGAHLPRRRLRDLHSGGWERILKTAVIPCESNSQSSDRTPTNLKMVRFLIGIALGMFWRKLVFSFFRLQWILAFRERNDDPPFTRAATSFKPVLPPTDRFFADPFVIASEGNHYVFFEDFSFRKGKGIISYAELDETANWRQTGVALEREYHLSYPHVFEWHGELWMIPETSANRTVELYRAVCFPDEWVLDRVLRREITAVDATVLEYGGKIWFFTNVAEHGIRDTDELSLFWAESLTSDWTSHPMNPIVSDVRRARPAGRIFLSGDDLIRPAQDCSRSYGHAVTFNRIAVLSETEYREEEVGRLEADWLPRPFEMKWLQSNSGTHSYSLDSKYEFVDGRILRRKSFTRRAST